MHNCTDSKRNEICKRRLLASLPAAIFLHETMSHLLPAARGDEKRERGLLFAEMSQRSFSEKGAGT